MKKLTMMVMMALAMFLATPVMAQSAGAASAQAFLGVMSVDDFSQWEKKARGEANARRFEKDWSKAEVKAELKLIEKLAEEARLLAKTRKQVAQSGKLQRKNIKLFRKIEVQSGTTLANHLRRERALIAEIGNINTKPQVRERAYKSLHDMRMGTLSMLKRQRRSFENLLPSS